jgi:hypothetical protein
MTPVEGSSSLPERFEPESLADMKAKAQERLNWLLQGYLAPGNVTLLTSLWKSGKSTLIGVLLSKLKAGGTLAGIPLRAGRAVVISEEPRQMWVDRSQSLDLDGHIDWFCQPFLGRPTEKDWHDLLGRVLRLRQEKGVDLLVIDSLANLSPMRSENDSVEVLRSLTPFQPLSASGLATLLSHHPKKGPTEPGQAARGSGALLAYVDIIVEMYGLTRGKLDRRRRLRAFSRHAETLPNLIIEWTADGTDYLNRGTSTELDFDSGWPILRTILEEADGRLTASDIRRLWPDLAVVPSRRTLYRWLQDLVWKGKVLISGIGTCKDPFKYWLPGMVEKWQAKFIEEFTRQLEEGAKNPPPPFR